MNKDKIIKEVSDDTTRDEEIRKPIVLIKLTNDIKELENIGIDLKYGKVFVTLSICAW